MKAAILLVVLIGCFDEPRVHTFVTVSRDQVLALGVDTDCACSVRVLAPGHCDYWGEAEGAGCQCTGYATSLLVDVMRDGVVVATGSGQVDGDFSGTTLKLRGNGLDTTLEVPADFPPVPTIITADASGVTWSLSPPQQVVVTVSSVLFGEYCRAAADETHVELHFSPDYQSLRVTSEVTTEPAPTLHLTMSSTATRGLPL